MRLELHSSPAVGEMGRARGPRRGRLELDSSTAVGGPATRATRVAPRRMPDGRATPGATRATRVALVAGCRMDTPSQDERARGPQRGRLESHSSPAAGWIRPARMNGLGARSEGDSSRTRRRLCRRNGPCEGERGVGPLAATAFVRRRERGSRGNRVRAQPLRRRRFVDDAGCRRDMPSRAERTGPSRVALVADRRSGGPPGREGRWRGRLALTWIPQGRWGCG